MSDWEKWTAFEYTDPLLDEITDPDFDRGLSSSEARQVAEDFLVLKNRFGNLVAWNRGCEDVCDDLMDKIENLSDEELVRWRRERRSKIDAAYKALKKAWDKE